MLRKSVAGVALSGLLVAGVSTAAFATTFTINTPMVQWKGVDDAKPTVDDATAFLTDFRGTGHNIDGWTNEAFDSYLSTRIRVYEDETTQTLSFSKVGELGTTSGVTTANYSATYPDTLLGGGTVTAQMTIEGNFVRFAFSAVPTTGTAKPNIDFTGQLGSDSNTLYTVVSPSGLVSYDSTGRDFVNGYSITTGTFTYDGQVAGIARDDVMVSADLDNGPVVLTVALLDYDPCSLAAAVSTMASLVPTFGSIFGSDLEPQFDPTCFGVSLPAGTSPIVPGQQVDILLPFVARSELGGSFSQNEHSKRVLGQVLGLPAGLSAVLIRNSDDQRAELRITGSTTQTGTFNVTGFTFSDNGSLKDKPLTFAFSMSVESPGQPGQSNPAVQQPNQLARTGISPDQILGVGSLGIIAIAAGLGILGYRRKIMSR
jgi:hypothetical protein